MIGRLASLVGPAEVVIKEFEVPEPRPGELLVRVRRANLCGSELHIFHFHHPLIRECVLGHEFIGEIAVLGEGVTTDYAGQPVSVGDRITAAYFITCHRCAACLLGDVHLCEHAYDYWSRPAETAPHFHGTFATHYLVHRDQYFYKVPDAVGDAAAAGANCGLSQVLFALDEVGLQAGQSLVIQGAGGLGLYAAAVARETGAHVIMVEGAPERIAVAQRFGVDEVVDMGQHPTTESRVARVRELAGRRGADVVIEVAGVPAAFTEALELVRPGGTVISIGNVNVGTAHELALSPGLITRKALRVQGFVRYRPWYLHRSLRFLERRQSLHPFDALSDRAYGLDEIGEAIARGEERRVARPAIVPA
jgi:threonine dehydrogenase-like Zn-dependent dehydrogenase